MTPTSASDRVLLTYIAECIDRVREYTRGERSVFFESHMVQDAVMGNLQTLAAGHQRLSESLKASEPTIPWGEIAGFRNVLTHGYLAVDGEVVWSVVEQDLPKLASAIVRMRTQLDRETAI